MKVFTRLVLGASLLFASIANANVILSLNPSTQDSTIGGVISVTVMVDGLGNFNPVSLSAFDLNIGFDTSALSFVGYTMFDGLGVASTDFWDFSSEAYDSSAGEVAPGLVHIGELSRLFALGDDALWAFQPGSFALAELFFSVNSEVTSAISFVAAQLFDASGTADQIDITGVNDTSVTGVPAPATLSLMGLALLGLVVRQKRYATGIK